MKVKTCKHCWIGIKPAHPSMTTAWIHENGWYGCDMARMFAGIRGFGLLGDHVVAEPEEVT